ncbi:MULTISPECIES: hypothetical protein [unclassified Rummeliibacillus]|uniref:hypothetical protein n=1 Tax=unclassified Rummeliibacillus TaxID=2622809 RepID=UPI000E66DBCE|nr:MULTISPECIES: hypothetical protein [unclassified Rummeliibacillus]RIJ63718.1 hypothetical protein D1606_13635 [Rummeliibacillus sp. POC4]RPJ96600.1 hypothetical protein CW357_04295 [Rummeliibacillus sp. TYF005]
MEFFYATRIHYLRRNRFYKIYVKEEELWLGQIGRQFYGEKDYYGNSIILGILYWLLRKIWVVPRGKKKEAKLDNITSRDQFLKQRGNVIIRFEDIIKVKINELESMLTSQSNNGTLTLTLEGPNELELILEEKTNLLQLEDVFHSIPVKRVDYLW